MTAIRAYRDDGPFATWIGRKVGHAIPLGQVSRTLLAAIPLVVVLVTVGSTATAAVGSAALVFVLLAGSAAGDIAVTRFTWLVPPTLRAVEYGFLIVLTARTDRDAMPLCFAFLTIVALHHYDTVYRLRHQQLEPPRWITAIGGGWDGRILIASALALGGILDLGFLASAVGLGLVYAGESTMSWLRFGRERHAAPDEDPIDGEEGLAE
jgi:Family of unknown function (DUF5941)